MTDALAYQNNFITNGGTQGAVWNGEAITGNITLYHGDAEGYPFARTVYEASPLGRPVQVGGAGLKFAITTQNGNPHITQYQYGVNLDDPGFLYNLPLYKYYVTIATDPDGHQMYQYATTMKQPVGQIHQPAGGGTSSQIKSSSSL